MTQLSSRGMTQIKPLIVGVSVVIALAVLAFWGGMPPAPELPKFLIGLIVLLVVGVGIGALAWILLLRPIPDRIAPQMVLSPVLRQVIGSLLVVAMLLEAIGGVWDETWHERYGIPFGKDFFWRPHILIYLGLFAIIVIASIGWAALMRRGTGSIVQRFRGEPILGMIVLTGVFLLYALPADPIWHSIYGSDLSAFSIPHVLLTMLLTLGALGGAGLVLARSADRPWQSVLRLRLADVIPVLAYVGILTTVLLLLTADWFSLAPGSLSAQTGLIFQRPDWVLPLFILFMAGAVGTLANHSLHRYGAGTLVGVLAVLFRLSLVTIFGNAARIPGPWLMCLPSLVLIDLFYAWRIQRSQPVSGWMAGAVGALGLVIALPLMNQFFIYPHVGPNNLLLMVILPALASILGGWLGQTIGGFLASVSRPAPGPVTIRMAWLTPGILLVALAFVIWFVATAVPPAV